MDRLNRTHYQATEYTERVLQFGEGNFLRAFADWQIDEMNHKAGFDTGVVVVQPLPTGMAERLNEQDGLYTVYLEGMQNGQPLREHHVMECVTRGIDPYARYEAYEQLVEQPELRFIISNTTEAGITFNPDDRLDDRPQSSYPGKLTALLYRRYLHFQGDVSKGFIIIPCELIDRNGAVLQDIVLQYSKLWGLEREFIDWLDQANTFCCSLVDRIVPGYPQQRMPEITAELGYEDQFVVVGEPFHLWVIEGPDWIAREFPAEEAGLQVKIVDDLSPYRTRKVRILNGAHTALTPVAYLYGLETVGQAVNDEVVGTFIRELIQEEIIPTLDLPEEELQSFAAAVMERFRNPYVEHYVMSIALNSISKFKTRDLPTLSAYAAEQGQLPQRLTFSLAALIAFYRGERDGERIALADDAEVLGYFEQVWTRYEDTALGMEQLVDDVLSQEQFWGMNLNEIAGLTERTAQYLLNIRTSGMRQALHELTAAGTLLSH
ncbi:tagaturonate reductase [Paenibacillus wulumuqiensis]|uniref:tagaturonate reductase n=1 Tax=Paenibacillus wulumuqiensis TaxID=1567107 RepID=UPI0006196349|nr:tagaturonate reductase [Paenibacillus wulumuqiensis]